MKVKLTAEQAIEIRKIYSSPDAGGAGIATLAARYRVGISMIYYILKGMHVLTRGLPDITTYGPITWDGKQES